jgi:Glycosyltransferase family 87
MTSTQTLIARVLVGAMLSTAGVIAWRMAPRIHTSEASFRRTFLALFTLSRLALFTIAFLILHLDPRGDIQMYMEEAAPALAGKLVYRDFITMHAPLHPYMLVGMLHAWRSALSIILFSCIFDILGVSVWLTAGRQFLPELTLRRAALLMLFNPTSLLSVAIDGQMNSLIALMLALGVLALCRSRNALSGFWVGLGVGTVKFLTLIFAPGYFFVSRRKFAWAGGFVAIILAIYVPFGLAGANLLTPVSVEGNHETDTNLFFLFQLVTGIRLSPRLQDIALALSWFCVVLFFARALLRQPANTRRSMHILSLSLVAELMCVLIFSKNCWDRYLVMTMFPLTLMAAELSFAELSAYAVWTFTSVFVSSYYASLAGLRPAIAEHALLLRGDHIAIGLAVVELLEVIGSCLVMTFTLRAIHRLSSQVSEDTGGRSRLGRLRICGPRRIIMPWGPIKKLPRKGMT